jgi:hypothetical protein
MTLATASSGGTKRPVISRRADSATGGTVSAPATPERRAASTGLSCW